MRSVLIKKMVKHVVVHQDTADCQIRDNVCPPRPAKMEPNVLQENSKTTPVRVDPAG